MAADMMLEVRLGREVYGSKMIGLRRTVKSLKDEQRIVGDRRM